MIYLYISILLVTLDFGLVLFLLLKIVYDDVKKRWINTEEDDAPQEEAFKPPPKMGDFGKVQQSAPMPGPVSMPPPASTPIDNSLAAPAPNAGGYGNPAPYADVPLVNNGEQPAKVPSLQSNMFKMQRNKSEFKVK